MNEWAKRVVARLWEFEAWPWWEKAIWIVAGLALLRLAWQLLEIVTVEHARTRTRVVAGFALLGLVVLLMVAIAVFASYSPPTLPSTAP